MCDLNKRTFYGEPANDMRVGGSMDFLGMLADLAYEERTEQENNVIKEHINCPYDNTKYVPSVDVTVKGIEVKQAD